MYNVFVVRALRAKCSLIVVFAARIVCTVFAVRLSRAHDVTLNMIAKLWHCPEPEEFSTSKVECLCW